MEVEHYYYEISKSKKVGALGFEYRTVMENPPIRSN